MRSLRLSRLLSAAALAAGSLVSSAQEKQADIPIQRVVMFSSGVAFYEHTGNVQGNATVDLKFNVKDINDLLKSMVLQDEGGGKISTVSYGSKDPITRTLSTFSINLTSNPNLADLLGQIRGEDIEIDAPTKVKGTILGVEKRTVPTGKDQTNTVSFVNLLTEEGLRSISLDNVGKIKLSNPKLDAELRQALMILAASKSLDKKQVSLNFLGEGKRPVRIGYIQESPIWKTSYRLVLGDDKAPFLQGWAIVENTTESDWNEVNLTLVSGRPISFVMDLYEPLYLARPEVQLELYSSLRPRTYDQDLAMKDGEFRKAAADEKQDGNALARNRALAAAPQAPGAAFAYRGEQGEAKGSGRRMDLQQGGQSLAQGANMGEMFRYTIATPVTLQRSRSAMLPIVNESVQGEKVSIYNESVHVKHPLNGLRLKNSTELHLMQGPITVFDDNAYAGDAQIQDLPPGTERLISYAMDLDTEVAPASKNEPQQLVSVKLAKGTLHTTNKHVREKTYTIKNSGKKAKKVLIEQRVEQPWALVSPKEPSEKTRDLYRFAVDAAPGKPAELKVNEEHVVNEQIAITNLDDGRIAYFLNASAVSEKVKEVLRETVKRKQAINAVVVGRQELERQIAVIDQEQKRIRDNMAQLPKDSDLFRRYVTKFTEQEDQVDALRAKVTAALVEEQKQRKSLDDYLLGQTV